MSKFTSIQFGRKYDAYKMRQLVEDLTRQFQALSQGSPAAGGSGSSVDAHNSLSGRDAADAHPVGAVTGLAALLATLQAGIDTNALSIGANSAAITVNSSDIDALGLRVAVNEADIDSARLCRYFLGE